MRTVGDQNTSYAQLDVISMLLDRNVPDGKRKLTCYALSRQQV